MRFVKKLVGSRMTLASAFALLFVAASAALACAGNGGIDEGPEIDPGSIGSAIALFSGSVMYLTSRRRAK